MRKIFLIILTFAALSCSETHFISDKDYRDQVKADFQAKKESLPTGNLFSIFDTKISLEEREALEYLYAYMQLADITDYPGEFHLENTRLALRTRSEFPWGPNIPEREFRHFVLPSRVNNEALDSCRTVFFKELKPRISNLSIKDAILEVNHWCHEKAVYQPSDSRTSTPLATIRTAYGRCGEESTFLVAALRSVGIPARQVYTPRWAHTDDNHAWVEAWADGQWYFLGACEPEPVLNLGWFNAPASRGMMMHTRVFGRYDGPEDKLSQKASFTEINVISNYADNSPATVVVKDREGKIVEGAKVEFRLYNYAEFYPIAAKTTDAHGSCSLSAGHGDLIVWASKEGNYGFGKFSFGKEKSIEITLDKKVGDNYSLDIDLVPPIENAFLPEVSEEQRAENTRRMAVEDSIRNAYTSTFFNTQTAKVHADANDLNDVAAKYLVASRGNHQVISNFLTSKTDARQKAAALNLLGVLSEKDLRDIRAEILDENFELGDESPEYQLYVRNPRISSEPLSLYKSFLRSVISKEEQEAYKAEPEKLVKWVADNIEIREDCNLNAAQISPEGVWKARVADSRSRDIFFVAVCRSLGIPARIDPVTAKVQLMTCNSPSDVDFSKENKTSSKQGCLKASYNGYNSDPEYYTHFTISKIDNNGSTKLQEYEGNWSSLLKNGLKMDVGNYILVSGTRLASGAVLSKMISFNIEEDGCTELELVLRDDAEEIKVLGNFNSELLFTPLGAAEKSSFLKACGRGYFVVGILGVEQEPTNHALKDLAKAKEDLEKWGEEMVLLFPNEADAIRFEKSNFPGLPNTISFGIDSDGAAAEIAANLDLKNPGQLPIFIITDTFNRIVFFSQGYSIGLGEQIAKISQKL